MTSKEIWDIYGQMAGAATLLEIIDRTTACGNIMARRQAESLREACDKMEAMIVKQRRADSLVDA